MTVAQATQGMSFIDQQQWINGQLDKTISDMKAAGVPIDSNKIFDAAFYDDDLGKSANAADQIHGSRLIKVYGEMRNLPVGDLRIVLAHEVAHTQQPLPRDKHEAALDEQAADHAMAQTYGAQASINMLQKLPAIDGENLKKHTRGDPHESIRKRQERIQKDFPEQHAVIPGVKIHPSNKANLLPAPAN